jgi:hypothetical protein
MKPLTMELLSRGLLEANPKLVAVAIVAMILCVGVILVRRWRH